MDADPASFADGLFFLLKVKCPVIARDLGCAVNAIVVERARAGTPAGGARKEA